jgi:ketosteroid isomerase-like protein
MQPQAVAKAYCEAWNRGDLEAIFDLFAADAMYDGANTTLVGRSAIRSMYERTFASGEGRDLIARPLENDAHGFSIGIYKYDARIAVKGFEVYAGLIVRQTMLS